MAGSATMTTERCLPTTGSGRFPVRGCAPLLSRIVDDQGERAPERRTGDVQFHRNIRSHRHGSSGPSPVGASRSLQTLLPREHVPAFGARVCMHPRTVAGPHDRVRENRSVALCCGKLQRPDDGDASPPCGAGFGDRIRRATLARLPPLRFRSYSWPSRQPSCLETPANASRQMLD